MPRPIGHQVMVITGASSGIGLATAQAASILGAKVALAARNARDLDRAVSAITRTGGEAIAVPTDVTDLEQVEGLAEAASERWGRIDTWVNNAAVSAYATFREQPLEDFRRLLEVNFMGQVNGARAALPYLEISGGALICVGSVLCDRGVPLLGAYSASKHALKGWLDCLRTELDHDGSSVRVSLVKPSSVNTPFFNKAKTQLGVMPRPIPPVYDVKLAVAAILRAAEGDVRDVYVGGAAKALSVAERVSPKLVDLHQLRNGLESQHTDLPKDANAPHNLYEPLEHDGGLTGDFSHGMHRHSVAQAVASHPALASWAAAALLTAGAAALDGRRFGGAIKPLLGAGAFALFAKATLELATSLRHRKARRSGNGRAGDVGAEAAAKG